MRKLFGFIPIPDNFPFFRKITYSRAFESIAKKCFAECDVDSNNRLSMQELYICLLLLYDKMNSKLPCHVKPPVKAEVYDLFVRYDKDNDGSLSYPEFLEVARALFADDKNWRDSIFIRVLITMIAKTAFWPFLAVAFKAGLSGLGVSQVDGVPDAVISHGLETVGKYVGGYITA